MHFINVNNVSNYNGKTVKGQRYNLFCFIIEQQSLFFVYTYTFGIVMTFN